MAPNAAGAEVRVAKDRLENKTYTVLVMTDGGSSLRKFNVTTRKIKFALWGLGVLVVLLVQPAVLVVLHEETVLYRSRVLGHRHLRM